MALPAQRELRSRGWAGAFQVAHSQSGQGRGIEPVEVGVESGAPSGRAQAVLRGACNHPEDVI
jgi:hypothetical protein